jgi:hypothetical protein
MLLLIGRFIIYAPNSPFSLPLSLTVTLIHLTRSFFVLEALTPKKGEFIHLMCYQQSYHVWIQVSLHFHFLTKSRGTTIAQVYEAMNSIQFAPFSIFPEYVKGGGGHHSGDGDNKGVPSGDVTLIVSVVDTYEDNTSYSSYEEFLDSLFDAMDAMGGG